jgi:hypothetical protein
VVWSKVLPPRDEANPFGAIVISSLITSPTVLPATRSTDEKSLIVLYIKILERRLLNAVFNVLCQLYLDCLKQSDNKEFRLQALYDCVREVQHTCFKTLHTSQGWKTTCKRK